MCEHKCEYSVHDSHFNSICWSCKKSDYLERDDNVEMGCFITMHCKYCDVGVMPKHGEGYCFAVRICRKTMKGNNLCARVGCKKQCFKKSDGSFLDYCGITHAKEDCAA